MEHRASLNLSWQRTSTGSDMLLISTENLIESQETELQDSGKFGQRARPQRQSGNLTERRQQSLLPAHLRNGRHSAAKMKRIVMKPFSQNVSLVGTDQALGNWLGDYGPWLKLAGFG